MARKSQPWSQFIGGLLLVPLLHLFFLGLYVSLIVLIGQSPGGVGDWLMRDYRWLILLLFPGVSQLIYLLPTGVYLAYRRRYHILKGLVVGALLTALLNGLCFGSLYFNSTHSQPGNPPIIVTPTVAPSAKPPSAKPPSAKPSPTPSSAGKSPAGKTPAPKDSSPATPGDR